MGKCADWAMDEFDKRLQEIEDEYVAGKLTDGELEQKLRYEGVDGDSGLYEVMQQIKEASFPSHIKQHLTGEEG